jgi:hypothetical protein
MELLSLAGGNCRLKRTSKKLHNSWSFAYDPDMTGVNLKKEKGYVVREVRIRDFSGTCQPLRPEQATAVPLVPPTA